MFIGELLEMLNKFPLQKNSQQEDGWLFFIPDCKTHNYHHPEGYAVFFLLPSSRDHVAPTSKKICICQEHIFSEEFLLLGSKPAQ